MILLPALFAVSVLCASVFFPALQVCAKTTRQSFIMGDACVQYLVPQGFVHEATGSLVAKYDPLHKGLQDKLTIHAYCTRGEAPQKGVPLESILLCSVDTLENTSINGLQFSFLQGYSKNNPAEVLNAQRLRNNSNGLLEALPGDRGSIDVVVPGSMFHEDGTSFSFSAVQMGKTGTGQNMTLGTVISVVRAGDRVVIVYHTKVITDKNAVEALKQEALATVQALNMAACPQ